MNKTLLSLLVLPAMCCAAESTDKAALKVGDKLPAVSCPDQDGKTVDLAKAGAKGLLLVYFYPKADTPGCTKQGCSLRDGWSELSTRGVSVYGVSVDSQAAQKAFKEKYKFPFPLLADKEKVVTKAFQSSSLRIAVGFAERQAYLFEDGVCIMADDKGHTADQAEQVLKFLDARKK